MRESSTHEGGFRVERLHLSPNLSRMDFYPLSPMKLKSNSGAHSHTAMENDIDNGRENILVKIDIGKWAGECFYFQFRSRRSSREMERHSAHSGEEKRKERRHASSQNKPLYIITKVFSPSSSSYFRCVAQLQFQRYFMNVLFRAPCTLMKKYALHERDLHSRLPLPLLAYE
jgi:hypothetical protein